MKWIIPDALAPAALTQPLGQALLTSDNRMVARLATLFDDYRAEVAPYHPGTHGCASHEWLYLQSMGLQPAQPELPHGAYLAALHAEVTDPQQRVWLAQASSTLITPDRAMLVGLSDLQATDHDLLALDHTLTKTLPMDDSPIQLKRLRPGLWQVTADLPDHVWLASPAAVQGQDLGDWWPTAAHWKPWRRALNEIQMLWHEHPVNEQREFQGLPLINGLWLYGGGYGWTPNPTSDCVWIDSLHASASRGDWQRWLNQYQSVLDQLLEQTRHDPHAEIVMSGPERIVTLRKTTPSLLSRLTPKPFKQMLARSSGTASQPTSWSSWWNRV